MTKAEKVNLKKWLVNLLKFTAPALGAFFGQLALGVELKAAALFGIVILWGVLADFFKKMK